TTGLVYYVTVLLQMDKAVYSQYMIILFALSFIFYVPVNVIAQKIGKKKLMIIAFILFSMGYVIASMLGWFPFDKNIQGLIVIIITSLPLAIFGILPNAIIADIAEADGIEKGNFKAGIFFGARTFMSKMGQMIAALVFPSLILLGKTPENDIGVRLTCIAACFFCIAGLLLFMKYDEKKIISILAKKEKV
ncbi:MAG TPA: MFS transporter, partial [Spirochaetota bacterium]|nr:MFS transporter [Spirochaetota bacterium]